MQQECSSKYRISGHETFTCRYTWLPKAVLAVKENPKIFSEEDRAIVILGVGKNMVKSIRFWSSAADIIQNQNKSGFHVTDFGENLFGNEQSLDPYLEDIKTLWLIHWKLSTRLDEPLFAWDYLLNRWHEPEIIPSSVLKTFQREPIVVEKKISTTTINHHFDTFIRTYVPSRGSKGVVKRGRCHILISD